ncbi:MAG: serine/threonine-protein kinase [Bacteroidetes bacterium]|nr:serine/threonine-protein kinase [Bacteroidota bacterium]
MPPLQINHKFANRYLLKKLIGVGGYSQVWLAEDTKAGNMEVAIKIYAPEKGLDNDGIETFGKEFTLVFNLNHAHLLKPMHYDVSEGSPSLVMQYCPNGSMLKRIGEVSEKELARFMHQAASALNYLHNQDPPIIHQDIKPDNFLIDGNGNYLLADFGISSKIRRTLTKSMGSQVSTGTLAYMPPEKFSADKQIIKAGDIFSLGVTMYELLTGDLPFGDHGGMVMLTGAQVPNLPPSFNPELNTLLKHCMAKEPWERPTAGQLEMAAASFLQSGRWQVSVNKPPKESPDDKKESQHSNNGRKTQPFHKQDDLHVISSSRENQTPETKPPKKKLPTISIIIAAISLVVIAVIFFLRNTGVDKQNENLRIADSLAAVIKMQNQINDSLKQAIKLAGDKEGQASVIKNTGVSQKKLQIGDVYAGGIIFYLDPSGNHGLVCTPQDLDCPEEEAEACIKKLNYHGYNDWFLPSTHQFELIYNNLYKNNRGHFEDDESDNYINQTSSEPFVFSIGNTRSNGSRSGRIHIHIRAVREF